MLSNFILSIAPPRATLTLNRPDRHNALDFDDLPELTKTIAQIADDKTIRILVLTGAGEKSFCSGVNLGEVGGADWTENPLEILADRIEQLPCLTICALNGGVYGGGTDLALACDFRLGLEGMKCFVPPARLGIHYHANGLRRAISRMGLSAAKRMFLGAETFDDRELLRLQFLDHLWPKTEFAVQVEAFIANLEGMAPLAVIGMKRALNQIAIHQLDQMETRKAIQACWASADFREGQTALREKRKPIFKGI